MQQDLIVGTLSVIYGLTTLVARFVTPGQGPYTKMEPMRRQFGPVAGTALHWFCYTVLPLLMGAWLLQQAWLATAAPS